jgi:putative endonuclease
MYTVYVLYSQDFNKIYIGYSADIKSRLESHNVFAKKGYTVKYRPWKLIYSEEYIIKKEAIVREKQLKSAKGREFIWNFIRELK